MVRARSIALSLVALLVLSLLPFAGRAAAVSTTIVISQLYGGGGNSAAPFSNDYVELFNRSNALVDLTGWSLQYASATGTGNFGSATNLITPLSGSLSPGQYLLVQEASGGATGAPLPGPFLTDATPINMSATGGKVALVNTATPLGCNGGSTPCTPAALATIVDLIGYDGANFFEGAGPAPTLSNTTAAFRAGSGCTDTDSNAADFIAGAPAPRTLLTPVFICGSDAAPSVAAVSPASGAAGVAVDANVTVTFSEPVNVATGWFSISCAASGGHSATQSGGPMSFTLDPDANFASGEQCTVTLFATSVSDQDTNDPPDNMAANFSWSFTTVTPSVPIHDIQGAAHVSPKNGQTVSNVQGIVTAKRSNGFYIQDPNPDSDPATSEGIFVFTSSSPTTVSVGDAVTVSGKVQEFRPGGASSGNLTTTELSGPTIAVVSRGNPLPPPIVVGTGGRVPPSTVIEDDASGDVETSGTFDPASDGLDFWESLEGMLVQLNDAIAVGPTNAFGETPVVGDGGANASLRTARGGLLLRPNDGNPERIVADDSIVAMPKLNVGDGYSGPLVGVIDYNFGNFFLEVTVPVSRVDRGQQRETTAAPRLAQLAIATFNVQNLDPGDGPAKFDTLAGLVVTNLRSPDLIGVEEIQDNNGAIDNGVVDADVTIQTLISAIRAAGGPTYDWRQISPVNDQDGGEPGGNIRQVFLFRTDRGLSFVDRPGGSSTTATTVLTDTHGAPQLSYSPGRIDPANAAWNTSRKPLAGEFLFRGHTFFAIVNHFNSKGGDQPLSGRFQPPAHTSEGQRHQQAQVVNDFVDAILAADPNADVAVLGDFNDFEFSDTIHILEGGVLSDLIETLPLNERYSYEFEGNAQVLDHILVSGHLRDHTPLEFDVVHVNAEFAVQASDHDPSVMRLAVDTIPPVFTSVPNDIAAATGPGATACGTVISDAQLGIAVATDVDPSVVITRTGVPADDAFSVGTTTITFTATDSSGNVATATQLVTVSDDTPPTVGAPGPVTVATGPGATTDVVVVSDAVLGSASFSDNCPGAVVSRSGVPAGNAFAVGTTTVTYAAIDAAHNTATAEQLVTVVDNTPPTIVGSATTSPNANGWYRAPVTVHFTCSDNAPGVTCPPDEVLGEGAAQSLTRTATDVAGNTASATVGPVNVDLHAPVIAFGGNAPSYTVDQTVAITCAVRDDLSGLAASTCPTESRPAYAIGLGPHTLTATATDRAGNQSTLSIAFTVVANETSLCALTRQLVTKPAIASSLCAKLTAAAAAAERGNADAHDGAIGAYVNELDAQRDKSISGPNADVLIALARTL